MTRAAEIIIDHSALRHNLSRVREIAPRSRVLAIIKDNGYGHGLVSAARAFEDADGFGVAAIEEALALRESGITKPVVLLGGFFGRDELPSIASHGFTVVIHHPSQLDMLNAAPLLPAPIKAWVKVDTGMHRLGFRPEQLDDTLNQVAASTWLDDGIVVMTHLASADDQSDPATPGQIACFFDAVQGHKVEHSIANSAGVLGWPDSHGDWIRPGLMLYGMSPFPDRTAIDHGLRPVMTLKSKLIAVNHCRKGDSIGYGGTWCCPEDMPIGVVAIGYGDGYPRSAANGTPVLINGIEVTLAGRVSMDMITVDLRKVPGARVGDSVTLWGKGLPVETVARHAGRIPYELTCGVAARVRRTEAGL